MRGARVATVVALVCSLLVALPGTVMGADPTRFTITALGSGRYRAAADNGVAYVGSVKSVVEAAARDLNLAGGGTVRFTSGTFDLGTGWLRLVRLSGIQFVGAGMGSTTIRNRSTEAADTEPFNFHTVSRIVVRDLTVSAGGSVRPTSDAIDFDNGSDSRIERVRIVSSRGRGIVFDGKGVGWSADRNVVRSCVIQNVPSDGIELLAAGNNLITSCRIVNVGGHGIQVTKASATAETPNKASSGNRITDNVVDESGHDGINVTSSNRTVIRGNRVTNSADVAAGRDGIRLQSVDNVACDDNTIDGNVATDTQATKTQRYGVHISSALCRRTVVGTNSLSGNLLGPLRDAGSGTIDMAAASVTCSLKAAR
jgi:parallel beta-helix repeat protein